MTHTLPAALIFPQVGPDRTPAGELEANLLIAHTGIMSLIMAVQEAAPQERDYAPHGPAAHAIATMEHSVACRALLALEEELRTIIDHVNATPASTRATPREFPRLAGLIADQPRNFPTRQTDGPELVALKENLLSVYRCSLTVIAEFQPATPRACDYENTREFSLARTQHQAWVFFVQRIGHWFLTMANGVRTPSIR